MVPNDHINSSYVSVISYFGLVMITEYFDESLVSDWAGYSLINGTSLIECIDHLLLHSL